jgi:hypothetical protein
VFHKNFLTKKQTQKPTEAPVEKIEPKKAVVTPQPATSLF